MSRQPSAGRADPSATAIHLFAHLSRVQAVNHGPSRTAAHGEAVGTCREVGGARATGPPEELHDHHSRTRTAALPSPPLLRLLRLAPHSTLPRRLDGAWWPRSYDLLVELPPLLAALPRAWGHIASVTVNSAAWSAAPGRMFVCNQVVRLRSAVAPHVPNTVVLLAPGHGRWDLLLVPPVTPRGGGGAGHDHGGGRPGPRPAGVAWTRGRQRRRTLSSG